MGLSPAPAITLNGQSLISLYTNVSLNLLPINLLSSTKIKFKKYKKKIF